MSFLKPSLKYAKTTPQLFVLFVLQKLFLKVIQISYRDYEKFDSLKFNNELNVINDIYERKCLTMY